MTAARIARINCPLQVFSGLNLDTLYQFALARKDTFEIDTYLLARQVNGLE